MEYLGSAEMTFDTRLPYRAVALAGVMSLFLASTDGAVAQESTATVPASIDALLEQPPQLASQLVQSLTGSQLAEALAGATGEQLSALVALLSPEARAALVTSLAQADADPGLQADLIARMVADSPDSAGSLIGLVRQNSAPERLAGLGEKIWAQTVEQIGPLDQNAVTALVLTTLSFDPGLAFRIVRFGNSADMAVAAKLARALVDVAETAEEPIVSAIELALALEGGIMARLVRMLRGEPDVAAIPDTTPPPGPVVGPAAIGGAGSTAGNRSGSGAGRDAIFANNSQGGGVPGAFTGLFPTRPGQPISP
jgi:hypothetical protein